MEKLNSILLIDDDHINNFIVVSKLKSIQLVENINYVENGKAAIEFINKCIAEDIETLPSLIFLDINMPIMDGWEFLAEFEKIDHKYTSKMHIYMVSSSVYNEDIEKSKQYPNVKMFISKPLVRERIEQIIRERMTNS